MAKKQQEMYDGRPVFVASSNEELAKAVANYDGKVEPPYVVKIPNRAKKIKEFAFDRDGTVGVVIISGSVSKIGAFAFKDCCCMTDVVIPDSVREIGESAFWGCSTSFQGCVNLTNIKVKDGNPKYDSREDCNAIIETATDTLVYGFEKSTIPNSVKIVGPI